ncbi:type II pantothenate kinase [Kipferlia bialata]|uniref:Type II pantothenate kinase n=1 Tax=Kipferlia bialata TaxID=797122 RepID=A0A9K3GEK6_9EUKA|nr:type II pantothenate kinase [Kipferlia bialata]|eukprot:g678.t1
MPMDQDEHVEATCSGPSQGAALLGGVIHFFQFLTNEIRVFIEFLMVHELGQICDTLLRATGGGAVKYRSLIESSTPFTLHVCDEIRSVITGLNFLLRERPNGSAYRYRSNAPQPVQYVPCANPYPYLLVNVGSGVSFIVVTGPYTFERVDGSTIGGGTFWGLGRVLTGISDFDTILRLAKEGNSGRVDMEVGDIYGEDYLTMGLPKDTIASSFAKVTRAPAKEAREAAASCNCISCQMEVASHDADPEAEGPAMLEPLRQAPTDMDRDRDRECTSGRGRERPACECMATSVDGERERGGEEAVDPSGFSMGQDASDAAPFCSADVLCSLLKMVSLNVGQLAFHNAKKAGIQRVFFGGYFMRHHPVTLATITYALGYWSTGLIHPLFIRHEGFLGSLGALVSIRAPKTINTLRTKVNRPPLRKRMERKMYSMLLDTWPINMVAAPFMRKSTSRLPAGPLRIVHRPTMDTYWGSIRDIQSRPVSAGSDSAEDLERERERERLIAEEEERESMEGFAECPVSHMDAVPSETGPMLTRDASTQCGTYTKETSDASTQCGRDPKYMDRDVHTLPCADSAPVSLTHYSRGTQEEQPVCPIRIYTKEELLRMPLKDHRALMAYIRELHNDRSRWIDDDGTRTTWNRYDVMRQDLIQILLDRVREEKAAMPGCKRSTPAD